MNLQHERITQICQYLNLTHTIDNYNHIAQKAAEEEQTYTDFLEIILQQEQQNKRQRQQHLLTRMAAFPCIKTLEKFA